jgi:hypothetical protein
LRVELAWRLIDVPDVGHDGRRMSDAAARFIAKTLKSETISPLD